MLDRTTAPPFSLNSEFSLLPLEARVFSNGVSLNIIHGDQQQVLKVEFIFPAGKFYEQTPGLALTVNSLISKGTKNKTSFQIAEAFDQLGSHIEMNVGFDFATITLYSLTKNAIPSLELLFEIFKECSFPQKEINQYKQIQIQNIQINNEKTSYVASKLIREQIFGGLHPYGWEASEESIDSIEESEIHKFYSERYLCKHVFISGFMNEKIIKYLEEALINQRISALGKENLASDELKETNRIIDKPNSTQTSVRLGKKIINRKHPDFFDLLFVNHVLGGYFGSRLMKNIREEKGLTYGIYSSISPLYRDAFFVIGADVNKENKSIIFNEIIGEINLLINQPLKGTEIIVAKNHFIGSLQAEMTSPFAHADKHKSIVLNNLHADYYTNLIRRVVDLNTTDVMKAASNYITPSQLYKVTVG